MQTMVLPLLTDWMAQGNVDTSTSSFTESTHVNTVSVPPLPKAEQGRVTLRVSRRFQTKLTASAATFGPKALPVIVT
jgi:hypothetical protein